jgi:putative transposase
MSTYGIHPPRDRSRWSRGITISAPTSYVNLIKEITPTYPSHIWTGDITVIIYQGKKLYLIEIQDRYTREIVGVAIGLRHDSLLVEQAVMMALHNGHPPPTYLHTDRGTENTSEYLGYRLHQHHITLSVSDTASPWQNPSESWHSRLKGEFGDPNRFETQGELIAELYAYVRYYNTMRIHTAIKMTPHQWKAAYYATHQAKSE